MMDFKTFHSLCKIFIESAFSIHFRKLVCTPAAIGKQKSSK